MANKRVGIVGGGGEEREREYSSQDPCIPVQRVPGIFQRCAIAMQSMSPALAVRSVLIPEHKGSDSDRPARHHIQVFLSLFFFSPLSLSSHHGTGGDGAEIKGGSCSYCRSTTWKLAYWNPVAVSTRMRVSHLPSSLGFGKAINPITYPWTYTWASDCLPFRHEFLRLLFLPFPPPQPRLRIVPQFQQAMRGKQICRRCRRTTRRSKLPYFLDW